MLLHVAREGEGGGDWSHAPISCMLLGEGKGEVTGDKDSYTPACC